MIPEHSERVTGATIIRNAGDCKVGRAVGGGIPQTRRDTRGMGAVTALSQRANNGDWTGRIMRRNPGVDRRMRVRFVDPATLAA